MTLIIDRHWDPTYQFPSAVLRVYRYWCLEVSYQQHTLGCFILFCRRKNVELESALLPEELAEKAQAMLEIELALMAHPTFRPDHFNYLQLGNRVRQLHIHGVPRYNSPREFDGMTWTDDAPGMPPKWRLMLASKTLVDHLRRQMVKYL